MSELDLTCDRAGAHPAFRGSQSVKELPRVFHLVLSFALYSVFDLDASEKGRSYIRPSFHTAKTKQLIGRERRGCFESFGA